MFNRLTAALEARLPEKRLFLKSDAGTRFIRLRPATQAAILLGFTAVLSWTVIITAVYFIDAISAGNAREQAELESLEYQNRLNALSHEVELRSAEALQAQKRFATAMDQVAVMQVRLLDAEERQREVETAMDVIQTSLRRSLQDRDTARAALAEVQSAMQAETGTTETAAARDADLQRAVAVLADALDTISGERDAAATQIAEAEQDLAQMEHELALAQERQELVFRQIEDAVALSMEPLDRLLSSSGIPTDRLIGQMRASYSGQGGPLMPISVSTMGQGAPDPISLRANEVLEQLDALNLRRMAAEQLPFSMPVRGGFRQTSGFGYRRDPFNGGRRLHAGVDFAGARGTDIVAGGDGTVVFAGRHSGYGLMVEIDHGFGIVTRYAHLTRLNVQLGERVSRGEHIGDMGCTGRCTGTHLHYEVRRNGDPVNPMTFITAGRDVF